MIKPLSKIVPMRASFLLTGYIPLPIGAVTMLNSMGGVGKSRYAMLIADKLSTLEDKKTLLWMTEDYPGQVRHSYDELIADNMAKPESLDNIFVVEGEAVQLAYVENRIFKPSTKEIKKISDAVLDVDASLLVLDPLLSFYGGNENDNSQADIFMLGLVRIAQALKISILLIHHNRKGMNGEDSTFRGATAFHNKCRARYALTVCKDGNEINTWKYEAGYRRIRLAKDSWGGIKYFAKLSGGGYETDIKVMPAMEKWL